MHKIGHNKYSHITHEGSQYTFHNLRDFRRTSEDDTQEQHRITDTFDVNKLQNMDMIITPFGRKNVVAHTMLKFNFSDGKEVTLSVEAQLDQGNYYGFFKALFRGYYNLFIRGTFEDHISIRRMRKEHPVLYPLHVDRQRVQKLFIELVQRTNTVHKKHERYSLVSNNCTSATWNIARHYFTLPSRHWTLVFSPWLPHFLKKKGVLKLSEKKRY